MPSGTYVNTTATVRSDIDFNQDTTYQYTDTVASFNGSLGYVIGLSSGTGTRQIDGVYEDAGRKIGSGNSYEYNLKALQQYSFGTSYNVSLTGIKSLVIRNENTGTNEMVTLAPTGSNGFTNLLHGGTGGPEGIKIAPGSVYQFTDTYYGTPVTANNRTLTITNVGSGSGAQNYNTGIAISIIVVGNTGS
tara:strand:+ start:48 stop:617 length:570 start_codon:yes stop_codon:yes gene_type:complete